MTPTRCAEIISRQHRRRMHAPYCGDVTTVTMILDGHGGHSHEQAGAVSAEGEDKKKRAPTNESAPTMRKTACRIQFTHSSGPPVFRRRTVALAGRAARSWMD
jgi:hypothetical protein